jgi:nucleoside-diphosphate-sugar epimerase
MAEAREVLITGGGGYLGRRIAIDCLEQGLGPVLLWGHGAAQSLPPELARFGRRVRACGGDLRDEEPFAGVSPDDLRLVIHAAAITRFNVSRDDAQRVNVEGTRKALRFAQRCPRLEGFGLVSSIYASGLRSGVLPEAPAAAEAFANDYEWSKWAAECVLVEEGGSVPWQVFRVATVVADDEHGRVIQHNAVHNTLRLLYRGLLTMVPGTPETIVYLVTGAFASQAIVRLVQHPAAGRFWNVAHSPHESPTLDVVLDAAFEAFTADEWFRRRRIPKPLYVDAESFRALTAAASRFSGALVRDALGSVAPFAPQLFVHKEVENAGLVRALGWSHAPDPRALVRRTCAQLVATRWGLAPPETAA